MRAGAYAVLGLVAGLLAGCDTDSAAPPSRATPPVALPSQPDRPPADPFKACLLGKGIRLPEDERRRGNEELMRTGIESCASLLAPGDRVRVPVVQGSSFQTCLSRQGVELPARGEWLVIDRREDRVMDAALKRC
ncbi:hypothetical protein [Actinomadura hibisca]|uniref:hypothetical protein n=1 Tax=Actinomadura hibisca TaxID=68565 RepID=UPI000AF31701|nr:hypothetical protein [Actinomadura hibisca]